ncbi:hypothetical protein FPOAC1_007545 [Fusarium poae]|uniref:hypothetical protein n=1 Tax=Fusarium poae TaxID=36050 RepID=UPI001CEA6872|nr:hypothetical protein FPOAC1_007545 [Fusarium poae]KAG8668169.1 hypothetical protein FPOAC1_007545 [Fusarium poae]
MSPGYIVQCRYDKYGLGQRHNNFASHEACSAMCEANQRDVCFYNAAIKVQEEEDPFVDEEDLFAQTCEEERDGLETQTNDLRENLDRCHADLEAASNSGDSTVTPPLSPPTCGVVNWSVGYCDAKHGINIENCRKTCAADSRCVSYSANEETTGAINCHLYDKETADIPDKTHTNFVRYYMRCR